MSREPGPVRDATRERFLALRRQVFEAAFVGYGAYYLVRTNLPPVAKEFAAAMAYDKAQLGRLFATSALAYGAGKLVLGSVSDRSNARWFMPTGLVLSALLNVAFAFAPGFEWHVGAWALNNFFQGMGWGPCGRILAHWFGASERGRAFGVWNVSHNIGGALVGPLAAYAAEAWGWRAAFLVPAALSLGFAAYLAWRLRDTPESVGLEGPRDADAPESTPKDEGRVWGLVLANPWMWLLAVANFFAYFVRYSLLDWGPTYLREARGASITTGGWSTFAYEGAAVAGTIFVGWLTDRLGGRRALLGALCVLPMALALAVLAWAPPGAMALAMLSFAVVGFCIYPLLMLFTVIGLDLTSKRAIGTAAGFIGLFGYLGKGAQAVALGWLAQAYSWDAAIAAIFGVLVVELLLLGALGRRAAATAPAAMVAT
jgi:OPA family glycerol-3-phosphate transporter-like MFS transporter